MSRLTLESGINVGATFIDFEKKNAKKPGIPDSRVLAHKPMGSDSSAVCMSIS